MNMEKRLDALYARDYVAADGKKATHWMKLGVAFLNRTEDGYDVQLQVLPPPTPTVKRGMGARGEEDVIEQVYRVVLRPPRPDGDQAGQQGGQRRQGGFGGTRPGTGGARPAEDEDDGKSVPPF